MTGCSKNGVRPVVEISFMPKKLAFNPDDLHPFWYKQNVSPPKSMEKWDALMKAFAQHLVDRYGIDEVSQVVLRGVERAEHRLLGRHSATGELL